MTFLLEPDSVAELLAPALDARPDVVVLRDGVLVGDPLPLKVPSIPGRTARGWWFAA